MLTHPEDRIGQHVASSMADAWDRLSSERRTAVTVGIAHHGAGTTRHDGDALAQVTHRFGSNEAVSVVPLVDVIRMMRSGSTIDRIVAPQPRPPCWFGMAADGPWTLITLDVRRMPDISDTEVATELREWAERSGIPQVNKRTREATREIVARANGNASAALIRSGIVEEVLLDWYDSDRFSEWVISQNGTVVACRTPSKTVGVSNRISDALMVEAFGARRRDDLAARARATSTPDVPDTMPSNVRGQLASKGPNTRHRPTRPESLPRTP